MIPLKTLQTKCDFGGSPESRLDRVVQQLTGLSRAGVRGLFDHGCISVNGAVCENSAAIARGGDMIQVKYNPHQRYKERPRRAAEADPAYRILYEDDHLLVVDKAAHILTVPTASGKGKTLIDALDNAINRGRPETVRKRLHIIHRLDQGVSGVLVVGKTAQAAAEIKQQFAAHKPQRIYIAIVKGDLTQSKGTFRSHLATDYTLNRYSTKKPGHGELAVTHYEVIERSSRRPGPPARGPKVNDDQRAKVGTHDYSIARVQLETGRRNQIRVHFAEAGHPVLGDTRYPRKTLESAAGGDEATSAHPKWKAKRLALHALSLEFTHPVTGRQMRFEAELPAEFAWFMQSRTREKPRCPTSEPQSARRTQRRRQRKD